ncbi:TPA: hypothetical protein SD616_003775 [Aeromonas hydrophila]|nr:hypothetical protein [Aeromonas hydrophila]
MSQTGEKTQEENQQAGGCYSGGRDARSNREASGEMLRITQNGDSLDVIGYIFALRKC